ncbi:uncharacterized protein LOC130804052 isoform X2 [Amaranthus tricolor]|uniref:uncharacterized protein LOC130804052 isoform X2 n=1 Tax=Amaranthus tricolor TaxID=29722 RepID=UPI002586E68D|nr:uncharacterized protein LOC130804052 isoform X2 [Amaranthus tricolor]
MENGWQRKCDMKFPCSTSRVTSTLEQIQLQEGRNQMNMNLSNSILPRDAREQGPLSPLMKQPPASNTLNFGSCNQNQTETGSLFRSLLSLPPALSKHDSHRNLPTHSSGGICIPDASAQCNAGTMPNWSLVPTSASFNAGTRVDGYPNFPSRPGLNPKHGSNCGLGPSDELDALRGLITHAGSRIEYGINTCLPKGVACASSITPAGLRTENGSNTYLPKVVACAPSSCSTALDTSLQIPSVNMKHNSAVNECPRVFCLGASGNLLLSSTGLFGIRCSCHGLHMSVAKFCEHSGLSDVNPGYTVRLDGGESIAQWRKVYLQKFGIRAPGDHRGWDWPEEVLATSGFTNSSMTVTDRRKVFDLSSLFNSSAESVNSTQPWNNVSTKTPRPRQECSNQVSKVAQSKSGFGHCSMGISRTNLNSMTVNPICPTSRIVPPLLPSGKEGSGNDVQAKSFNLDLAQENSFTSFQNLQSVDFRANNTMKDDTILHGSTIPSSIELKLGQPSQRSLGPGSAVLSAGKPQTTVQEKLTHNSNAKVIEQSKPHIFCHSIPAISKTKEPIQTGPLHASTSFQADSRNNMMTCTNGVAPGKHSKNGLDNKFAISVQFPPSNTLAGGSSYNKEVGSRMPNSNSIHPWVLHSQTHVDRSVLIDFACNENSSIRPFDINKSAFPNNENRNTDAASGCQDSIIGSESGHRLYGNTRNGTFNPSASALPSVKFNPLVMANGLSGVSGASNHIRNAFDLPNKVERDHSCNKTKNSSSSYRVTPTAQETSTGFSQVPEVKALGHGSASFREDVETLKHISDESLRLLALRNIDRSVKGKTMDSSLVFSPQTSNKKQLSKKYETADLTAKDIFLNQGPFEGQWHGRPFPVGHIVSPSLLDADHKEGAHLDAVTQEIELFSDLAGKNEDQCNSRSQKQPSPSVERQENMRCDCKTVERCYKGSCSHMSDKFMCNDAKVYLKREPDCNHNSTMHGLKKQTSIEVVETPKCSSRFANGCVSSEVLTFVDSYQKGKNQILKPDCRSSQWVDVPSKANTVSKMRSSDAQIHLFDAREKSAVNMTGLAVKGNSEVNQETELLKRKELSDIPSDSRGKSVTNVIGFAAKGTPESNRAAEMLKVKELSDNSSKCSAPAVTQASNEINTIDSSTVDVGQTLYGNSQIADQGSAILRSCSSVEAVDSVRSSQYVCDGKTRSSEEKNLTMFGNVACHVAMEELEQTQSKSKELQKFTVSGGSSGEVFSMTQNENGSKLKKRKCITKWKMLGASCTVSDISLLPYESRVCAASAADHHAATSEDFQIPLQPTFYLSKMLNVNSNSYSLKQRKKSKFSVKKLSRKRDLNGIYDIVEGEPRSWDSLKGYDDAIHIPEISTVKKLKQAKFAEAAGKQMKGTAGKGYWMHTSIYDGILKCSSKGFQKAKPIACGKYGIICDQELDIDQLKPPKIVPLSQVLKASKKSAKFDKKSRTRSTRKKNKNHFSDCRKGLDVSHSLHQAEGSQSYNILSCQGTHQTHQDSTHIDDTFGTEEIGINESKRNLSSSACRPQSKTKEIRMRSLYELSMRGNKFISADTSRSLNVMFAPSAACELEMVHQDDNAGIEASNRRSSRKLHYSSVVSKAAELCCVCGVSNRDDANCLLECGHCSIRIHQACYGISRVPKGDWFCRPCRTNSKDVACVLCGYGGGAMTRAFGSRHMVKGLLKAWDIRTEPHIMNMGSAEALYVPAKMELQNNLESATHQLRPSIKPVVHNSIISGLFDPTVKQWVHMVCGLWTPGTRCPNVDTMSAFDVSGLSHLKEHMGCYICKRAGGSCIQCRVETCYTHFHPWCAHQKGLLQSEVEGVESDKVGFYGRCMLHANSIACHSKNDADTNKSNSNIEREDEPTCAREKDYQVKQWGIRGHYSSYQRSGKSGCFVTQVQLDAWSYINRHKLRMIRQPKSSVTDVDHDYRKEYTRFKQAKGWKHLVVYKSGIHALGLYTSQFIQHGAMVVEYIGEIVGPRVADKREAEYLSGKKLQYKSACYFFRIDKEQIIDATCKGGIARFVNHSCQPNCVAKVLTVRGEKKVVFFAQRDINPGEEITYDYHFNHEDEGKKIPCFCNSKNCRRYLN